MASITRTFHRHGQTAQTPRRGTPFRRHMKIATLGPDLHGRGIWIRSVHTTKRRPPRTRLLELSLLSALPEIIRAL